MSLVDPIQIQTLLTQAKLTSMSQIVAFIANHVHKATVTPIADLEERVSQLQQPRGMDRIMIEQVKTLVDAMLDQRQQIYKRDVDRRYGNSFEFQEQSRRSLNQIDFTNLMNMPQSQQLKKNCQQQPHTINLNSMQIPSKGQSYTQQIQELRGQIMSKPERRQFLELKQNLSNISKEVVSKVTFDDAQKMMIRFQKQIFVKLNQERVEWDEVQCRLFKTVQQTSQELRQELAQIVKGRNNSVKLQKKVKKYLEQMAYIRSDLEKLTRTITDNQNLCSRQHKSQLDGIEMLQGVVQKIAEQDEDHSESKLRLGSQGIKQYGMFMTAPITTKNCQIAWQRSLEEKYGHLFEFQSGKTTVRVVNSGFYEIVCCIWGGNGKKAPILLSNNQTIGRLQAKNGGQSVPKWVWREWVHLSQPKSTLSVRYQGDESNTCALLYINSLTQ